MFDVGVGELAVLGVLALVIFGPERLPGMAAQAGRALRQLRHMASDATRDLRDGLGPEYADFDPRDLNPRQFVRRHLFEDDDEPMESFDQSRESTLGYDERPPFDTEAT